MTLEPTGKIMRFSRRLSGITFDGPMTIVRLYLMTKQKLVQLQRRIKFDRVPCVGEWLKFERSGLSPHEVTEVTHDEHGAVEVVIGLQKDETGKILFHETAKDLQADVDELIKGGWNVVSEKPNRYSGKQPGKRLERLALAEAKRRR